MWISKIHLNIVLPSPVFFPIIFIATCLVQALYVLNIFCHNYLSAINFGSLRPEEVFSLSINSRSYIGTVFKVMSSPSNVSLEMYLLYDVKKLKKYILSAGAIKEKVRECITFNLRLVWMKRGNPLS